MDRYTIFDLIKQTKTVDGIDEQRKLIGRLLTKRIDMLHTGLRRI
jgi:hypothetical protein